MDALLDSLKTTAKENAAIQNSGNELSEDTIRRIVEESMEAVLNKHNFRHEDKTPSDPTPVKTDDPIQKFPVPPIPVPQPTQSYYPSQPAPTPAATDTGMNTLLSMADAFY